MLNDFRGIEGKKITVRSAEGSTHMLAWPNSSDTVELKGDVTLENVHISPKTLYAQGHHLTLGEGFGGGEDGQKRMIVYGGSKGNLTANTHVTVLDGVYKLIAGGNSAGTLTGDTHVEFGGSARFPNASEGKQEGDFVGTKSENYNLYLDAKGEDKWNGPVFAGMKQRRMAYAAGSNYGYGAVYGAGCNDIILGTTSALLKDNAVIGSDKNKAGASVVSQGKFSALTPMGRTSESRCYLGGALFDHPSEIQNSQNKHYAATAEVSGGSVDVLMAGVKSRKASKQPMKTCNGNVQLKQSGGAVLSIESGSVYEKNLVINGNADILVTGGTTEEHILGRYRTSDLEQRRMATRRPRAYKHLQESASWPRAYKHLQEVPALRPGLPSF